MRNKGESRVNADGVECKRHGTGLVLYMYLSKPLTLLAVPYLLVELIAPALH